MGLENAYCEKDKNISLNTNKLYKVALQNKKWLNAAKIKI
jgi:hypothetical protein